MEGICYMYGCSLQACWSVSGSNTQSGKRQDNLFTKRYGNSDTEILCIVKSECVTSKDGRTEKLLKSERNSQDRCVWLISDLGIFLWVRRRPMYWWNWDSIIETDFWTELLKLFLWIWTPDLFFNFKNDQAGSFTCLTKTRITNENACLYTNTDMAWE